MAAPPADAKLLKLKEKKPSGSAVPAAAAASGGSGSAAAALKIGKESLPVPLDVEMARMDAVSVCNPDINRPFTSLEDACERLLPFHVLADYDADEIIEREGTGQVLSRSQIWNETLTAKIIEFKSNLEKQIETFNIIMKKQAEGDFRAEERLMIEQFLLQEEKQKLIDVKIEVDARERAEREAEARMKEALAQAERTRAEAQAQAEAQARAEAARAQAEAVRLQAVQAEAARLQAHAEAVRLAQVEVVRIHQAHAEAARIQQVQAARIQQAQADAETLHFVNSQMQAADETDLEVGGQEQDDIVEEMLESWVPLNGNGNDNAPEDFFTGEVHDQGGMDRGFQDIELLTNNAMQGEWKRGGALDLNSLN
eukprot:c19798_g1_i1 orf=263-1369(-)